MNTRPCTQVTTSRLRRRLSQFLLSPFQLSSQLIQFKTHRFLLLVPFRLHFNKLLLPTFTSRLPPIQKCLCPRKISFRIPDGRLQSDYIAVFVRTRTLLVGLDGIEQAAPHPVVLNHLSIPPTRDAVRSQHTDQAIDVLVGQPQLGQGRVVARVRILECALKKYFPPAGVLGVLGGGGESCSKVRDVLLGGSGVGLDFRFNERKQVVCALADDIGVYGLEICWVRHGGVESTGATEIGPATITFARLCSDKEGGRDRTNRYSRKE
ncbi:hypothetical protein DFH07DRAFT_128375 [Mycena maculata]|uniref:Uncharacterized protein n=1 Tax=Mycena maculata TaxID=230809 RepID=A0AAD7I3Z9_9AGAR|nr:hypothetical protein DFH07DRAFT_128375 [Mycena maculata]